MRAKTDKSYYLQVDVYSEVRFGLFKRGIVELGRNNATRTRQLAATLAAAMAEELCNAYGDTIDPSAAASQALAAYDELNMENPLIQFGDEEPYDGGSVATH